MSIKSLKFPPTDEQKAIRKAVSELQDNKKAGVAIDSGAGTGKTSTAKYLLETAIPDNQSVMVTMFNREPKEALEKELKTLKLHPKAKVKTLDSLAYSWFFASRKIDFGQGKSPDKPLTCWIDNDKYKIIADYVLSDVVNIRQQIGESKAVEDPEKAYYECVKYLETLANLWRNNTTIDSDVKFSKEWKVKLFAGGLLGDKETVSLVEFNPDVIEIVDQLAERYTLTIFQDPELEEYIKPLLPQVLRLGKKACDDATDLLAMMFNPGNSPNDILSKQETVKQWVDFADMSYRLVVENGKVKYKQMWLVIDEAQDLSPLNRAVLQKFRYVRNGYYVGRVILIGDPKQAIYGFRGADAFGFYNSQYFFRLGKDQRCELSKSFRVSQKIGKYAKFFKANFSVFESNAEGEIAHVNVNDMVEMAQPGDALISRTVAEMVMYWHKLTLAGKPVRIKHRNLIKPIIDTIENIAKLEGFKFGDFETYALKYLDIQSLKLQGKKNAQEKLSALKDKVTLAIFLAENFEADHIDKLIEIIKVKLDPDNQPDGEFILITTAHSSKGLEFNNVFIITPDKFPMIFDNSSPEAVMQEYNLKYVAITRAKIGLYMLDTQTRAPSFVEAKKLGHPERLYFDIPVRKEKETASGELPMEWEITQVEHKPDEDKQPETVTEAETKATDIEKPNAPEPTVKPLPASPPRRNSKVISGPLKRMVDREKKAQAKRENVKKLLSTFDDETLRLVKVLIEERLAEKVS